MSRGVPSLRRVERFLKTLMLSVLRGIFRLRRVPPLDPDRFSRILVIRQHNQLGDMLCVTPLLRSLRERYPEAFLALLTSPANHDVMLHHSALDAVLNFDKRDFLRGGIPHPLALRRFLRLLRAQRFDLVLVPATVSTSTTSDLLARLTGARTRIGAGSINGRENPSSFFYTHPLALVWPEHQPPHQTRRNLDIAAPLKLSLRDQTLNLTLTPDERREGLARVREWTGDARPVIAYHVGAGKPPNRWPAEKFAALINLLARESHAATLLISGPMDEEPVAAVVARLAVPYHLLEKQAIRHVASCLASVDLLVTNDTGIMHVGAASGTPVLSLFGPTDPHQWAPLGDRHRYIKSSTSDISTIAVGEVAGEARQVLRSMGAPGRGDVKGVCDDTESSHFGSRL